MSAGRVLALVPDLMDRSKVSAAAGALDGVGPVSFVSSAAGLATRLGEEEPVALVVLDLARTGALDTVAAAHGRGARVIGFGSHVEVELLAAARAAGCDQVLARSAFFARLPEVLTP